MTQEEKQLLLKDLCPRLPYRLKFQSYHSECGIEGKGTFDFEIGDDATLSKLKDLCESGNNKPYLRPMSSMTEDEQRTLDSMCNGVEMVSRLSGLKMFDKAFDWLNAHHFDYKGLIEKGLAVEAPEGMYKAE